jgi:hypothetical protein
MTTTPNLLIDHIAANQAQKEVTANAAFDALDKALCQLTSIAIADVDTTLTDAQMLGSLSMKFTGTLTAGRTITIPAKPKLLMVENATTGGFASRLKRLRERPSRSMSAIASCSIATARPFRSWPRPPWARASLTISAGRWRVFPRADRSSCAIRCRARCVFLLAWPIVAAWRERFWRDRHIFYPQERHAIRHHAICGWRQHADIYGGHGHGFCGGRRADHHRPNPADSTLADIGFALAGIRL